MIAIPCVFAQYIITYVLRYAHAILVKLAIICEKSTGIKFAFGQLKWPSRHV